MRILVSEGTSRIGSALLRALPTEHRIRILSDEAALDTDRRRIEAVPASLTDAQTFWHAVRGVDAVVLTGQVTTPLPTDDLERERALLDIATRGTHALFEAAVDAGVRRFVYCSTLELFRGVPDDVYVSEQRRPDPGTDMRYLSHHLAEQVTREFARAHAVTVTVLRLGRLESEDDPVGGGEPDLMWLDPRDAAAAVVLALGRDRSADLNWTSRWSVLHVCAEPPHPKFLLGGIRALGFEPRHNFGSRWAAS